MRRLARVAVLMLWTAGLSGCLLPGGETVPMHTHVLRLDRPLSVSAGETWRTAAGALVVSAPLAQAGVDSPRMVYLLRPHEVSAYATHQWTDTPARMLVPLLVQALERTGAWKVVVPAPTAVRAEYRLDSELLALEQQFFQQPSRVRLALRARLVELKSRRVLGTRGFEVVEEAPSDDADGGVTAANRAAEKLLDEVAAWAGGCATKQQPSGCE